MRLFEVDQHNTFLKGLFDGRLDGMTVNGIHTYNPYDNTGVPAYKFDYVIPHPHFPVQVNGVILLNTKPEHWNWHMALNKQASFDFTNHAVSFYNAHESDLIRMPWRYYREKLRDTLVNEFSVYVGKPIEPSDNIISAYKDFTAYISGVFTKVSQRDDLIRLIDI